MPQLEQCQILSPLCRSGNSCSLLFWKYFVSWFWYQNYTGHGIPVMVQWRQIQLGTMRLRASSLESLSGLRIWHCRELWYRSQMCLRFNVTVAVAKASSCSSYWTPSLGISIFHKCGPKKQREKKKKERKKIMQAS